MLLTELDSFYLDHRLCGELQAGVDSSVDWIACGCGAWPGERTRATHLPPTIDSPYRSGMDRRRFLLTSLAGVVSAPFGAGAQPAGRVWRIGALLLGSSPSRCLGAFQQSLKEFGYAEGQNYSLETRFAEAGSAKWPQLADELVRLKVDVIFTDGTSVARDTKQVTSTIPIVIGPSTYPVETGVVASLARPGGNITGIAMLTPELLAKRLEILKEAVPSVSKVTVLRGPGGTQDLMVKDLRAAATQFGIQVQSIEIRRVADLPGAFQSAVRSGAGAVMSTQSELLSTHRIQVATLALQHRLPSLSGEPGAAAAGTLIFHGPDAMETCRRAAYFVDRIFKGANPANLPLEQPTKVELIINLKTAKALGLTIPPSLLARADQVIE
jgi:putative tryptophan/tyrosine transport system substrate-binding protein